MRILLLLLSLMVAAPAWAQDTYSTLANPASQSDLATVQATMCQPLAGVPPAETVSGSAGSGTTCRLSNSVQPRITRAANCTLDAGGACSITWSTALSSAPTIVTTPVNPVASQPLICNSTATPSTTAVSIKCWTIQTTTLSLAIVTSGLNLAPATTAPAGTVVQVIAIPPTQ